MDGSRLYLLPVYSKTNEMSFSSVLKRLNIDMFKLQSNGDGWSPRARDCIIENPGLILSRFKNEATCHTLNWQSATTLSLKAN